MQLELLQVNHNYGYVISVVQSIGARSMHILNFNTKDACCELMGRQQKQPTVINCLLCCRTTTCLSHMQTAINK